MADDKGVISLDKSAVLSWGTALVLSAIAFATIGATSKDNKEQIKINCMDVKQNRERIHAQEVHAMKLATNQQLSLSNQEKIMTKLDGLYNADEIRITKGVE